MAVEDSLSIPLGKQDIEDKLMSFESTNHQEEFLRREDVETDLKVSVIEETNTLKQQDEFLNGGSQSIRNGSGYEGRGMRPHSHAESFTN